MLLGDLTSGKARPGGDYLAFAAHSFRRDAPVKLEGVEGQPGVDQITGKDQVACQPG